VMPSTRTPEERGVAEWARLVNWPTFGEPNRGTEARGAPAHAPRGELQQQQPYAGRQGPLMKMLAAVEGGSRPERVVSASARAAELEALERERVLLLKRLPSLAGGATARFLHADHQKRTKIDRTFGVGWGNGLRRTPGINRAGLRTSVITCRSVKLCTGATTEKSRPS
jgi:hypothetical protein